MCLIGANRENMKMGDDAYPMFTWKERKSGRHSEKTCNQTLEHSTPNTHTHARTLKTGHFTQVYISDPWKENRRREREEKLYFVHFLG